MSFKAVFTDLAGNGLMNIDVADAYEAGVELPELKKIIKQAIKMHSKWATQPGSSYQHIAVAAGLIRLLAECE